MYATIKVETRFVYTEHILEKLERRGITKKEVEEAVLKAQNRSSQYDKSIRAVYFKNNRKLVVIYRIEGNKIILITTFRNDD